jgi:hypothetical protein
MAFFVVVFSCHLKGTWEWGGGELFGKRSLNFISRAFFSFFFMDAPFAIVVDGEFFRFQGSSLRCNDYQAGAGLNRAGHCRFCGSLFVT